MIWTYSAVSPDAYTWSATRRSAIDDFSFKFLMENYLFTVNQRSTEDFPWHKVNIILQASHISA